MVLMSAAFRDRLRRALGDADPEPPAVELSDGVLAVGDDGDDPGDGEDPDGGEAGEWLAYELHEWALESRVMLQQLLVVDKVVHSWQGTTLMVHESLEETVDGLVDEVEEAERAKEATTRPIGSEDSLTAFELAEWPEALRAELVELLVQARVPHVLDTEGDAAEDGAAERDAAAVDTAESGAVAVDASERDIVAGAVVGSEPATGGPILGSTQILGDAEILGDADQNSDDNTGEHTDEGDAANRGVCDLLVREADEERVELLIDDLLAREEEAQFEELDGLEVNNLLSALFVACDRLRRDPGDVEDMRSVAMHARRIAGVRTPFGFSASSWRSLRDSVGELLASVEDMGVDSEDRRELAHRMSDTLRTLV